MSPPIETKVSLPAIVTLLVGSTGGAIYALLLAYGVIDPTEAQAAALAGCGATLLSLLQTALAYYAPHTPRPDLPRVGSHRLDGDDVGVAGDPALSR